MPSGPPRYSFDEHPTNIKSSNACLIWSPSRRAISCRHLYEREGSLAMVKWRLMITTLPFVVLATAAKLFLEYGLQWPGVVDFSEVGIVLTAGVFLTGFMLAGVMADYKESEKLPGELAAVLETLEEVMVQGAASKPTIEGSHLRPAVLTLTQSIRNWLRRAISHQAVFDALSTFHGVVVQLERDGAGSYASRAVSELNNLRRHVTRIGVISRTGFLAPAYALLETLLVIILVLVMASKFKSTLAMTILVPFITLIYVYMLRLIRDIDDPFDYAADGQKQGGAEVDLFPLDEYHQRLSARVGAHSKSSG